MRYVFMVIGANIGGLLGLGGGAYVAYVRFQYTNNLDGLEIFVLSLALLGVGAILGTLLGGGLGFWVGKGMQTLLRKNGFKIAE